MSKRNDVIDGRQSHLKYGLIVSIASANGSYIDKAKGGTLPYA
ncbi:hypothetical protein N5C39_24665 [Enterobacter bugandensis]|uniref:Uncharacterized protein n=1 Tax=Enterobacter bugandensis TaxID=881260 RepID=A0AA42Q026_9ENTR|nr:hypothetical protein [Enterobacter bugandensis]MDH1321547.1 hypothetical protein [Enterobacter bugandensis]